MPRSDVSPVAARRTPGEMRPLRILHLRNASGYYGAERCIVAWMGELIGRGHSFDLAVYPHPAASTLDFLSAARELGVEPVILPRSHGRSAAALGAILSLVRRRGTHVIHAHENRSHGVGWLVGGLTGTPVVGTVHGYVPQSAKARCLNTLNRWFLGGRRLAALTAPTHALRASLGRHCEVMPNAVPAAWIEGPLAVSEPPGIPTFGVVARLNPEKGVDVFLDAIDELPASWRFEVVGEGVLREALAGHPAASRVRWLGFRPDARARMRSWSAVVIPSRTEGVPIALLEALAQGVPVIASAVGGIPEVTGDDGARLVPVADPLALARAMRGAVEDTEGTRSRALRGREIVREGYTLDRVGDALERIYHEAAGGAS